MGIVKRPLLIAFLFAGLNGISQEMKPYNGNPDTSFHTARDLAFSGKRKEARDSLQHILTGFPENEDVRTLLGKIYSWEGDYDRARAAFNKITSSTTQNKEVWVAAIKNELYAENHSIALGLANKALRYLPQDPDLEALRNEILENSNKPIAPPKPTSNTQRLADSLDNKIAVYSTLDIFDQVFDPMASVSLEYTRSTKLGSIIPRINYAHRFQTHGIQYELDAYPKFSKTLYAYLNYGYSNASIFPNHRFGAELYINLPKGFETSAGLRYLEFQEVTAQIITGSIGHYHGNYYFSLRPYVTLPVGVNPVGFSGSLLARKYLKDKNTYLGMVLAGGYAPELRQLRAGEIVLAETLLYIETYQLQLEYQFSAPNNPNSYRVNTGVMRQEFAFDSGAYFWAISAGLSYNFKF